MEQFITATMVAAIFGLLGMDFELAGLLNCPFCGIADIASMLGP